MECCLPEDPISAPPSELSSSVSSLKKPSLTQANVRPPNLTGPHSTLYFSYVPLPAIVINELRDQLLAPPPLEQHLKNKEAFKKLLLF